MGYLAFCTFDLKNASSRDYENAYAELRKIGLKKVIASNDGTNVVIPTTAAIGTFDGSSASSVRDDVRQKVKNAFTTLRLKSEIFIVVGGDWAWGAAAI